MSFVPPLFKDFGKAIKDLCTKKIDDEKGGSLFTGQVLKFSAKSDSGVKIDSYTRNKEGVFLSCLDSEYGCPKTGTKFTLKLNSKTEVEVAASSSKLYDGVKATITGKWKEKKGKWLRDIVLDSQYTNKDYGFVSQEKVTVELDTNTVKAEKAKGAESAFTVEQLSLGVEMKKKDITCSLLTKPQSEIELGFVKTSPSGTKLGGKFSIPGDGSDDVSKVQLALNHKLDADTSLYGTFDSTGSLKGTVAKKFSDPSLTFSLTFGMDISKGYDLVQPVGVAIALGDA